MDTRARILTRRAARVPTVGSTTGVPSSMGPSPPNVAKPGRVAITVRTKSQRAHPLD